MRSRARVGWAKPTFNTVSGTSSWLADEFEFLHACLAQIEVALQFQQQAARGKQQCLGFVHQRRQFQTACESWAAARRIRALRASGPVRGPLRPAGSGRNGAPCRHAESAGSHPGCAHRAFPDWPRYPAVDRAASPTTHQEPFRVWPDRGSQPPCPASASNHAACGVGAQARLAL